MNDNNIIEILQEADYNYKHSEKRFQVHTKIGKLLIGLNKLDENSALYLSCSDEEGAKALGNDYLENNYNQEINNEMTGRARVA